MNAQEQIEQRLWALAWEYHQHVEGDMECRDPECPVMRQLMVLLRKAQSGAVYWPESDLTYDSAIMWHKR